MEYLYLLFAYPFSQFIACFTGICAPLHFPFG
ncbi:MAG: hypothetical protein [Microvirus sp.]|nr:MAG: hypothetical protein [Microvirus sp.]